MPTKKNSSIIELEDIKSLLRIASKNWYILLISLLLASALSYVYTYKLTNIYAAQTQIKLEADNKINQESIISENFDSRYANWFGSSIDHATEISIIQSFDLVENAVKRMKLDVSYFIVGRIKTTEVYNSMPFTIIVQTINPALYEQDISFKILSKDKYKMFLKKNGEDIIKEGVFNKEFIDADIKLTVINNGITEENISSLQMSDYLIQVHSLSSLVYRFQGALSVEVPELTNILQIKLEDVIPERAKDFLDTLSKVYIENGMKTRLDINYNTLKYIERQMVDVVTVLTSIEDTMQGYKENKGILDLSREESDYFNKMSLFDSKRSQLKLQQGTLNSLENYIIEGKDPQFLPPAVYVISDDAFLKQSTNELYALQISLNEKLNGATENNYGIKELEQRVDRLKNNLLIYINNSRKAIEENMVDVDKQITLYIANIKTIPKKQRELLNIQRNFDVNQRMYLFLLEKKSNTIIGRAAILPETKVIEIARSIGIVRPNKQKIFSSFLGGGLILALIIIFIRVSFYAKIESIEELKTKTNLPILGEILYSPSVKDWAIAVEKESKSPITESFRTIRTNLQYMAPGKGCKVVVISSNNPGEGKTFTSLNIAAILAKAGKKVLILELDLHKPKVQKALNIIPDKGISTVLIGKDTVEEAIKPTEIENMFVILSGPTPPNPSEMILLPQMDTIFNYLRENFDYIIVDTPPVGLISDALVLMKQADISLFVLNTKYASKHSLNNAHEIVEMNKIPHFGFILNAVKRKRSKYYYNRYSYGYGYGYGGAYGYGSNDTTQKKATF